MGARLMRHFTLLLHTVGFNLLQTHEGVCAAAVALASRSHVPQHGMLNIYASCQKPRVCD